jgi:hypothetical protein
VRRRRRRHPFTFAASGVDSGAALWRVSDRRTEIFWPLLAVSKHGKATGKVRGPGGRRLLVISNATHTDCTLRKSPTEGRGEIQLDYSPQIKEGERISTNCLPARNPVSLFP